MKIKFYLINFIFFTITGYAFGQSNYKVNQYTSENGLPQNSIKDIAADSDGFIWLATEDGLVRFDGRQFKVFTSAHLKPGENRVNSLKHGLHDLHVNGRNKVLYAPFWKGSMLKIEKGAVSDDTVYYRDKSHKMQFVDKSPLPLNDGIPSTGSVTTSSSSFRHVIYVGSSEDDFYIPDYDRVSYYKNCKKKYDIPFSIEGEDIHNYFSIKERLYFFHQNRSITRISGKKTINMPLSGEILRDPAYKIKDRPIRLYWDNDSDQAFLYLDKNFYMLVQQKDGTLETKLLIENFDFDSVGVGPVHFDGINNKVYLGSATRGLFVLSKQSFQALSRPGDNLQNVFYSQASFSNNTVLTPTGLVIGKDGQTGQVSVTNIPALKNVDPGDQRSIAREEDGTIWSQRGNLLYQIDGAGKNILRQWKLANEIKAIYKGEQKIWLAVIYQGLFQIDKQDTGSQPRPMIIADAFKEITYLESQTPSTLLVGTQNGLYIVDTSTKKFQLIQGTKDLFIKSIYVANQNQIWITALEKGLMLIDKGELTSFPLDKNKYLASPHCVVNDGLGYLWIPTNRGLFQMALKDLLQYAAIKNAARRNLVVKEADKHIQTELFYSYHTMEEGFNTNEFNGNCQPCAVKLANGYISLPSLNGLVWFKPDQIDHNEPDGEIVLDKVEVNLKAMTFSGDTLRFPVNPENIRLDFTTPYFGNDYNLNLSYALVNQNTNKEPSVWIPISNKDFTVRYSSLKSGKYVLMIKKLNGFGLNNYTLKKIYFNVPPVWYETIWAYLVFISALFLAIYFYFVYRLGKVNRENLRLEEIILLRTNSLENALQELGVSKNQLSGQVHVMSRLLASMSHDVQSPLHFIASASGDIPDLVRQGQLENISRLGMMISDLSSKTSNLLEDLLDYIKIQVYGNSLHFERINLKRLIDSKLDLFEAVIVRKGNDVVNEIADTLEVTCDYLLLSIVVHNLIDNAVKYTSEGEIRISAKVINGDVTELVISNIGSGIPQKIIDMINTSDGKKFQGHGIRNTKITGLGLLIVKEIADLIGVTLRVDQTDLTSFYLRWNEKN